MLENVIMKNSQTIFKCGSLSANTVEQRIGRWYEKKFGTRASTWRVFYPTRWNNILMACMKYYNASLNWIIDMFLFVQYFKVMRKGKIIWGYVEDYLNKQNILLGNITAVDWLLYPREMLLTYVLFTVYYIDTIF